MAVYNAAAHLRQSMESILGQSFSDFEVVAVDDGSTDGSGELLEELAHRDGRIRVVHQDNAGLARSLNTALGLAQGQYAARMDADDLCHPERFARQVGFLDSTPSVALCGTWVRTFGTAISNIWRYPVAPREIKAAMLFVNPVAHPTVMARREVLQRAEGYDTDIGYGEDYATWARLCMEHDLANLGQVLMRYRVHSGQMGAVHTHDARREDYMRTQARMLRLLGIGPDESEGRLHHYLSTCTQSTAEIRHGAEVLDQAEAWLLKLFEANRERGVFPEPEFTAQLCGRWYDACRVQTPLGLAAWRRWRASRLSATVAAPARELFWLAAATRLAPTWKGRLRALANKIMAP